MSRKREAWENLAEATVEFALFYVLVGLVSWWLSEVTGMGFWMAFIGVSLASMLVKLLLRDSLP